ncbi:MAG: phosphate ABC transporter permease subunit PstC [Thermodesulfobacteriota bacterium]
MFHLFSGEAVAQKGLGRLMSVGFLSGRKRTSTEREVIIRRLFVAAGMFSLVVMGLIVLFLFTEGLGLFREVSVFSFLLGTAWYPTYDPPDFGILPLIVGSGAVTLISSVIAVPLGVGTALYLCEVAGNRTREILKPAVELLASLPSVVLGFVGMVVLAPLMQQWWDIPTGLNILNASLMLALMAIPTIASISEDALHAVPRELNEASLALGATRWETLTRVQLPGALSGIGTAVILGMSRAMGETMVVLMVAGGAAQIPISIFDSVRPLPASIAAEMGETPFGSEHYHALFAIGIVLFLMTLAFNLVAAWFSRRFQQKGAATL